MTVSVAVDRGENIDFSVGFDIPSIRSLLSPVVSISEFVGISLRKKVKVGNFQICCFFCSSSRDFDFDQLLVVRFARKLLHAVLDNH